MLGKKNPVDLHKDDVVESTTSRPLHTVGTTLEADAAKHGKNMMAILCSPNVTVTVCNITNAVDAPFPLRHSTINKQERSLLPNELAAK